MERRAEHEIRLVYALLKSEDTEVSSVVRERLQRLPSMVYWTGLLLEDPPLSGTRSGITSTGKILPQKEAASENR